MVGDMAFPEITIGPKTSVGRYRPTSAVFIAALVALGLISLPLSAWLDLRNLSERTIRSQAEALGSAINSMRSFYSSNVVARVRGFEGKTQVVHNYMDVPGAIPIPATLSLELGSVITGKNGNVQYRFFSDYPASLLQRLKVRSAPADTDERTPKPPQEEH